MTTICTGAAGTVTIVRDIIVRNTAGVVQILIVEMDTPGGKVGLLSEPTVQPNQSVHLDLRQELKPGANVTCFATAGPATCVVTGYVFPLA